MVCVPLPRSPPRAFLPLLLPLSPVPAHADTLRHTRHHQMTGTGAWTKIRALSTHSAWSRSVCVCVCSFVHLRLLPHHSTFVVGIRYFDISTCTCTHAITTRSCPKGHLLINTTIDTQICLECDSGTYVLDMLLGCEEEMCNKRPCVSCPVGNRSCMHCRDLMAY